MDHTLMIVLHHRRFRNGLASSLALHIFVK